MAFIVFTIKPLMLFLVLHTVGDVLVHTFYYINCMPCNIINLFKKIAGKYRTGKSYLMNRLAGGNSGFGLGATIQSETKGIWMWAKPHPQVYLYFQNQKPQ